MGVNHLKEIIKSNLKQGKKKKTPIAIIEKGCTPFQRTTIGTLENIIEKIKTISPPIMNPAIILIGKVVSFRKNQNSWYENKELFQKKIVIFKEKKELPQLVKLLEELGAIVIESPLLSYQKVVSYEKKLIEEIKFNHSNSALLFTSSNSVNRFFEILKKKKIDNRILANYKIVTIGKGTADTLKKYFIISDFVASKRSQEGVWEIIKKNKFKTILYPRPKEVRNYLEKKCKQYKINLFFFIIYKMKRKKLNQNIVDSDLMLFTSGNIVSELEKNIKNLKLPPCICIGGNTINKLKQSNLLTSKIIMVKKSSYVEMTRECILFLKKKDFIQENF